MGSRGRGTLRWPCAQWLPQRKLGPCLLSTSPRTLAAHPLPPLVDALSEILGRMRSQCIDRGKGVLCQGDTFHPIT